MQAEVQLAIDLGRVGAVEHHGQIAGALPVRLGVEVELDHLVEACARQGIADTHADVIGHRLGHQGDRLLDVDPGLARIPELDEEAGADAALAEPPAGAADLLDRRLLVHRVEHTLAAALGSQPHLFATGAGERIDGLVGHEVAA